MCWPPGVPFWPARLAGPGLDYLEGIVPPPRIADALGSCRDREFAWWLLNEATGEVVRPRCKATNKCSYCRRLGAIETCEMIALDAEERPPSVYAVLTCRARLTRALVRRHLEHLRRCLRRRWPALEWFCTVEWQRRGAIHLNLLCKGVDVGQVAQFRVHLLNAWLGRVDAVAEAQYVGAVLSLIHI